MKLPADLNPPRTKRRASALVIASLTAFLVLVVCMLSPLVVLLLASGLSLESEMPEKAGWLLVVGSALGAGAAYLTFRTVLLRFGGFESHEIDGFWNAKRKNK